MFCQEMTFFFEIFPHKKIEMSHYPRKKGSPKLHGLCAYIDKF